jgi:predicted RNase H-like HicB family nuclease
MDKYAAVIHKDEDSAYGVYFPDAVGCFAAGETEDEALDNARVSLRIYAEDLIESGQALPRPRTIHELRTDKDVRAAIDEGGFVVLVPLLFSDKKRRVNVTLEPTLIAAIDEVARISGTSRSDYLAHAAWRAIEEETGAVKVAAKAPRRNSRKERAATRASRSRLHAPA